MLNFNVHQYDYISISRFDFREFVFFHHCHTEPVSNLYYYFSMNYKLSRVRTHDLLIMNRTSPTQDVHHVLAKRVTQNDLLNIVQTILLLYGFYTHG